MTPPIWELVCLAVGLLVVVMAALLTELVLSGVGLVIVAVALLGQHRRLSR